MRGFEAGRRERLVRGRAPVDMAELEQAYRDWIPVCAGVTSTNRVKKMQKLIGILFRIKSVYPKRLLYDCSSDESKPPFIVGRTALGSED